MATRNYPCVLFNVTEHQVAALLAAVKHTQAGPRRWSCPATGSATVSPPPAAIWRVLTRRVSARAVNAWLASSLLMPYRLLQRPQRQIPIVWPSTGPRRPRLVDTRTVKHGHAHLP